MGKASRSKRERRQMDAPVTWVGPEIPQERLTILEQMGLVTMTARDTVQFNTDAVWSMFPDLWVPFPVEEKDLRIHRNMGTDSPIIYYCNRDYQVAVFDEPGSEGWPSMWHLSLKRRDREPIDENRWRILQTIKNGIVGPEHEAIELYPAESRLVDLANQYHLYVLKNPEMRFPFGFQTRMVATEASHGAKQRPFEVEPEGADNERSRKGMEIALGLEEPQ